MTEASIPRSHWLLLAAAALLGFFSQTWNTPLFDLDEGAFSEATLEMLGSGNYLTTTLDGEARYDKPILIYWLQAASVKLLGADEFAFRLPSALCATLWMLATLSFTRRYAGGARSGLFAAMAVALGLMSSVIGHAAIADALLDLLLALTCFDLWRHLDSGRRLPLLRCYAWIGLGFLAKGPVAMLLPAATSALFCAWQHRWRDWLRAALDPQGWLLMLVVLSVWLVPLWRYDHGVFLEHFLIAHNLHRYAATLQGHGGQPWYYLVWLPLVVLPFSALLPQALAPALSRKRTPLQGYLLIWFGIVFVLMSASATQLPHYLLYGCPGLFVLFGQVCERAPARWLALTPALLLAALLAALPWLLPLVHLSPQHEFEAGIVHLAERRLGNDYRWLAFGNLFTVLALIAWPGLAAWRALLAAAFAQGAIVWFGVVPALAAAQQQPVKTAALRARDLGLPTVTYDTYLPSFSVYRGAPTPHRLPRPGELVFLRRDRIDALQRALGGVRLAREYQSGGIVLYLYPANVR
ncbi:MAG: glycosyltransferase family 39 protein [Gammaproteobacteria bacterium]|nr:glycosyltransferase family 39 protein [Gammaproteobacteria bacterium]